MRNKGILSKINSKGKHTSTNSKLEITVDDIREWKKQLHEANITERKVKLMKYCPHREELVKMNLPMEKGDCELCYHQTWDEVLKNHFKV